MTKNFVRMFALSACAALFSLGSLNAEVRRVSKVQVPFEFRVMDQKMPAGEYRLEQEFGSDLATIINETTGQRARVLRPVAAFHNGKSALVFSQEKGGLKLKMW